jgi:hypothetical protein
LQADAEEERKMEDDIKKAEAGDRAARKRVDAARLDSLQKKQVRQLVCHVGLLVLTVFCLWSPHYFSPHACILLKSLFHIALDCYVE